MSNLVTTDSNCSFENLELLVGGPPQPPQAIASLNQWCYEYELLVNFELSVGGSPQPPLAIAKPNQV